MGGIRKTLCQWSILSHNNVSLMWNYHVTSLCCGLAISKTIVVIYECHCTSWAVMHVRHLSQRISGMVGLEKAYNFHEIVSTINIVNQLACLEYGEDGIKFGRTHGKVKKTWVDMHPLQ